MPWGARFDHSKARNLAGLSLSQNEPTNKSRLYGYLNSAPNFLNARIAISQGKWHTLGGVQSHCEFVKVGHGIDPGARETFRGGAAIRKPVREVHGPR
jgi:hypothetical protein